MGLRGKIIAGCLLAVAIGGGAAAMFARPAATLTVVADDLIFRGDNPTLYAPAGKKVKVVFRNEANGIIHQFTIEDLAVTTDILQPGDSEEICFSAPRTEQALTYACKLHSLMKGKLIIGSQPTAEAR